MSAPLPGQKVVITNKMIAAGASAVSEMSIDLADGFVSPAEVAEAVFLAMQAAQEDDGEGR